MKTGRIYQLGFMALGVTSAMFALAAPPVDASDSEAGRRKELEHARMHRENPKEAFDACRGRSLSERCVYVIAPQGTNYRRQVDGSCWAPESRPPLPLVCR